MKDLSKTQAAEAVKMKKPFSLLLTAALLCGLYAAPAFAAPEAASDTAQPSVTPCSDCEGGEVSLIHESCTPWGLTGYDPCTYGVPLSDKYKDTLEIRRWMRTYQCDVCGRSRTVIQEQTRRVHDHPSRV